MAIRFGIPFQECDEIEPDNAEQSRDRMDLIARAKTAMLKRGYLDYRFLRIDFKDEYVEFMVG